MISQWWNNISYCYYCWCLLMLLLLMKVNCYHVNKSWSVVGNMRCIPASGQQHLSVHLHWGSSSKLSAAQVSVVRRVDEVMRQRMIHLLINLQPVQKHRSVLIRHQIPTESVTWHQTCTNTHIHPRMNKWDHVLQTVF